MNLPILVCLYHVGLRNLYVSLQYSIFLTENSLLGETQLPLDESDRLKSEERRKRKRKSRWGDAVPTTSNIQPPTLATNLNLQTPGSEKKIPMRKCVNTARIQGHKVN